MTARKTVERYLEQYSDSTSSLCFCHFDKSVAMLGIKNKIKRENLKLFSVITIILANKEQYYSKNIVTMEVETYPGRHRSSLDIWRHCKLYFPDVTLLDVMHELYIGRYRLRYQMCGQIHKRVFDLDSSDRMQVQRNAEEPDEYGLLFRHWKDINK